MSKKNSPPPPTPDDDDAPEPDEEAPERSTHDLLLAIVREMNLEDNFHVAAAIGEILDYAEHGGAGLLDRAIAHLRRQLERID